MFAIVIVHKCASDRDTVDKERHIPIPAEIVRPALTTAAKGSVVSAKNADADKNEQEEEEEND